MMLILPPFIDPYSVAGICGVKTPAPTVYEVIDVYMGVCGPRVVVVAEFASIAPVNGDDVVLFGVAPWGARRMVRVKPIEKFA